ncbi:GGDEF domain-containing protein [Sneathiella chinensis]|uniref:diguanylate cyclase n=1 Tax=Sneathiella chinensis TaxID=349750 RepID=A0ABQ5U619_9PROT|nr:GGDEF domain-containing protein [Sneathiella chinensis]GLQ07130.1 GGDEF domain-containing protein [Sneathiella chinensis]
MAVKKSFDEVASFASMTMALLEERKISKLPQNYTIWYEYFADENPDLKLAVNRLMKVNGRFTDQIAREIYDEFFSHEKEGRAIRETNQLAQQSMQTVLQGIEASSNDLSQYGETLNSFAENAGELSAEEFTHSIQKVINETRQVSSRSASLNQQLLHASTEIETLKKRLEAVEKEALTDTLTGLANRKLFDRTLSEAANRAKASRKKLCLVMSDIDHFKTFNDTHGHVFGDQVLKLVASTIKSGLSANALPARYGGEEFSIILPDTDIATAESVADALRASVSSKKLVKRNTGDDVGRITMSFGVAEFNYTEDLSDLVGRADKALYMAKKTGRNKVIADKKKMAKAC